MSALHAGALAGETAHLDGFADADVSLDAELLCDAFIAALLGGCEIGSTCVNSLPLGQGNVGNELLLGSSHDIGLSGCVLHGAVLGKDTGDTNVL